MHKNGFVDDAQKLQVCQPVLKNDPCMFLSRNPVPIDMTPHPHHGSMKSKIFKSRKSNQVEIQKFLDFHASRMMARSGHRWCDAGVTRVAWVCKQNLQPTRGIPAAFFLQLLPSLHRHRRAAISC
jgi:hypothetical protein